ncbi:MAG: hypothetical protein H6Q15_1720 [Bacteroidetes bacterium]|nr:hypothetical protein [Bacteroidota bacterium]
MPTICSNDADFGKKEFDFTEKIGEFWKKEGEFSEKIGDFFWKISLKNNVKKDEKKMKISLFFLCCFKYFLYLCRRLMI